MVVSQAPRLERAQSILRLLLQRDAWWFGARGKDRVGFGQRPRRFALDQLDQPVDRDFLLLSGSRAVLPPPRPLRTVHEPFDSHGSSLSFAPCGTRFLNIETLAMDLLVAVGV
jgi:hypothetical protein